MASTTFVDGETLIEATWLNDVNDAIYNPAAAIIPASSIVNTPAGNIAATDVQAAINELDTEKQPLDALLISLAGQTTAAGRIQGYSGVDTAMLYTVGTVSGNVPLVGTKSATESLAGLVELATQAEAEAGADNTVVMTPLKTAQAITALSPALGVGQTWQDVKASPGRFAGTTYTNSTGKPIQLSIATQQVSTSGCTLTVGGVVIGSQSNGNAGGVNSTINAIVPDNTTYVLSAGGTITYWAELR